MRYEQRGIRMGRGAQARALVLAARRYEQTRRCVAGKASIFRLRRGRPGLHWMRKFARKAASSGALAASRMFVTLQIDANRARAQQACAPTTRTMPS
jgi:hypothetical protein